MWDFKKIIAEVNTINDSRKECLIRAFTNIGKDLMRIQNYKVWQDGNQPKGIETNQFLDQKLDYIHANPVEVQIVDLPEHYLYSSARDYAGNKGLINIERLV